MARSDSFSMIGMIKEKRDGHAHTPETLAAFVAKLVEGALPDYQVAAWLMAVVCRGMTMDETAELTRLVAHSGAVLDLTGVPGPRVDKHSTGGVGDKVTLIFAPLLAACGATVAKLSGRGLGHTGGTADKLEAIPGFNVSLTEADFVSQLKTVRGAVACQTQNLAPADKILYALRDVTATVESMPLIAVSVLSKKIAAGADVILLDVKAGSGAFMPDVESAVALSEIMISVGARLGKRVLCVVTGMDQPLGRAVGHANEVAEAISTLRGEGPADLTDLCVELGGYLLVAAGLDADRPAAEARLRRALSDGTALAKFKEIVVAQGGDPRVIETPALMPQPAIVLPVLAPEAGYVTRLDALQVGLAGQLLGAGRLKKTDVIDLAVGVNLLKKEGDAVAAGEPIAELLANDAGRAERAKAALLMAYGFGPQPLAPKPLVLAALAPDSVPAEAAAR